MRCTAKVGPLVNITPVHGNEELMLISADGTLLRIEVSEISVQGRTSQGVKIMRLGETQDLAAVALVRGDTED